MSTVKDDVKNLNAMIADGKILEAFDKYYADDVVMQENNDEPRVGKAVNRKSEEAFAGGLEKFHDAKVLNVAINDNVSFVEWYMDLSHKEWGRSAKSQVAVQTWKDGKILKERFYYPNK